MVYRSSPPTLTCPQCATGLAPSSGDVPIFVCATCGGAWIDAQASVAVLQGKADPSEVQRRSSPPSPRTGPETTRSCARCNVPMLPYPFGGVLLDTCPAHGTWFDHDEIERVVKAARKASKEPALDLPSGNDIWETTKFTVGMMVMPFAVVAKGLAAIVAKVGGEEDDY